MSCLIHDEGAANFAEKEGTIGSWTCKPNSVRLCGGTAIPLGCALLRSSSDLPGGVEEPPSRAKPSRKTRWRAEPACVPPKRELPPYLVLLRVGFALPATLLPQRCALTAPFHPYPAAAGRYVFCGTFRQPALTLASRTLSGTLLCGVRTFLPRHLPRRERPSGPAAYIFIIVEC